MASQVIHCGEFMNSQKNLLNTLQNDNKSLYLKLSEKEQELKKTTGEIH